MAATTATYKNSIVDVSVSADAPFTLARLHELAQVAETIHSVVTLKRIRCRRTGPTLFDYTITRADGVMWNQTLRWDGTYTWSTYSCPEWRRDYALLLIPVGTLILDLLEESQVTDVDIKF